MDPGPLRDALTLALGFATGVLSGAFGVGGAVISTPGIRLLGADAITAIGTTLPSIIPGAATGTLRYRREGMVHWPAVAWTAPVGIAFAVAGAWLAPRVPGEGHLLQLLIAGLLGFSAVRLARGGRPAPAPATGEADANEPLPDAPDPDAPRPGTPGAGAPGQDRPRPPEPAGDGLAETDAELVEGTTDPTAAAPPIAADDAAVRHRPAAFAGTGVVSGLLSGLLGIGGGVVMVPAFTVLAGLSLKRAIATSLACVGIFAVPGTITHALQGGIDWRFALLLAVGVVPGARVGSALTLRATDRTLRCAVGGFLGAIAVLYAAGELVALLRT